jgi:ABC-type uncharacterized transport system involved in gliding motility auxiliary subunit
MRPATPVLAVLGALALAIGANRIADRAFSTLQLDLTRQKLYTLSPGTGAVLANLADPITLRLYYSRRLGIAVPSYGTLADRVRSMLAEYVARSHGKLTLRVIDPEPYSDAEDQARGYGLQEVPLDQSGDQVFFGLAATNLLDDERAIGFFKPEREAFLEYDLTKLIWDLSNPAKPVLGVLTPLPLDGDPALMMQAMRQGGQAGSSNGAPWVIMQQLRQSNTVKMLPPDSAAIPDDVQVLMVAQPQHLSDATLYAIDQFVMRGGRLFALVDPESEAEVAASRQGGEPAADVSSNLRKLFDRWGISFDPAHVVGDPANAWRVRGPSPAVGGAQTIDYLPWFNVRDGISRADPATADLTQVSLASAGVIGLKPGSSLAMTPLLSSSDRSGLIDTAAVRDPDPARILTGFQSAGGPRVVAARFHGPLHSAFDGPPTAAGGQKPPPYKAQTDRPATLVVAGDTDLLADRFWVQVQNFYGESQATPFSDNGAFVENVIGTLAGGDALIGLRSRAPSLAPFEVVTRMQEQADAKFRKTEQDLQTHLDQTVSKLRDLRQGRGGGTATVTAEQTAEIEAARADIMRTRTELRHVQLDLQRDIRGLETRVKIADIAAVPAALTLLALGLGLSRARRRRRTRRSA